MMRIVLPFVAFVCLACGPSVEGTEGGGGAGESPVSMVVQTRGDQIRLVASTSPLECATADAGPDAELECGNASIELFFPAERLQVGPLIFTDDIRMHVIAAINSGGGCFPSLFTNSPNHRIVIEEVTTDAVTVRLTGFAQDLDGDGSFDSLLDGVYVARRCALEEPPLDIPKGQFVLTPFDLPKLTGSSEGATCEDPERTPDGCDTWSAELSVPAELLVPGTVGEFEVEASIQANMFGDGPDSCGGGIFGGPFAITIEEVTETEIAFTLPSFDFGTSVPIAGSYVAPICR